MQSPINILQLGLHVGVFEFTANILPAMLDGLDGDGAESRERITDGLARIGVQAHQIAQRGLVEEGKCAWYLLHRGLPGR